MLSNPITEPQIPGAIARDTETVAAIAAHVAEADPHIQYLLQSEGDARYKQSSALITDAEIPNTIARDTEIVTAVNAHLAALDPHPQYLLPSEGDTRYLRINSKAADSETIDGIDSSRIVFGEAWHKASGANVSTENVFATSGFIDCYSGGGAFPTNFSHIHGFQARHGNGSSLWGMQAVCQYNIPNEFYFRTVNDGSWNTWKRIWNDGNFNPSSHPQNFTSTIKGIGISLGDVSTTTQANNCGLEVQAANSSSTPYISFHRPQIWGIHLGLDTNNQLSIGGWSLGNNSYKIFREGGINFTRTPLPTAALGANSIVLGWNSLEPGQGTAEICNYSGTGGGDTINFFRVPGSENSISIFHRTARIDKNGAYLQVSDKRTKTNFSEAPGLSVILKLLPQKYKHWECTGFDHENKKLKLGKNFTEKIGFLAQEVKEELPEAVVAPQQPEGLYSLDYNVIIACLVKAVQELSTQLVELRAQVQIK